MTEEQWMQHNELLIGNTPAEIDQFLRQLAQAIIDSMRKQKGEDGVSG